jgi:cytoskeletal protein RodZ
MKSEKRYKDIEDKIIAAADTPDYAFNEASWKKMEALLDKKKDRRKPFFWIFGLLLLGAFILGGQLIYQSINTNKQSVITAKMVDDKNNDKQQLQPSDASYKIVPGNQSALPEKNTGNSNTVSVNTDAGKDVDLSEKNTGSSNTVSLKTDNNKDADLSATANKKSGKVNTIKITKQPPLVDYRQTIISDLKSSRLKNVKTKNNTGAGNYNAVNKNIYKDGDKFAVNILTPDQENDTPDKADNKTTVNTDNYLADAKTKATKTDSTTSDLTKNKAVDKPDTVAKKTTLTIKRADKKEKNKKGVSGFYVFGSVGAEASSTKLFSYKKSPIAPGYGLGLGYKLNKRFSVQAGFYAGAKKYIAGPKDYNVKAGSYLSTVKIIKVDANCLVYEVPVTLQYNWLIKPKANYYAAIGLSSYIMKKEKYNYTFEMYNTQYSYPYDYTKNSHLFASLQLSLGMEKQIGRKLYIQAAPTVTLPLQGVGEGSVKIFTTRLHVGLKYFPFKH